MNAAIPGAESFAPRRETPIFRRLAIIGIGLIGSSIARAARSGSCDWLIGRPTTRIEAPSAIACAGVTIRF